MAVTFSGGGYAGVTINIIQPAPPGYYLWSWGRNAYGQIGDGTTINRSSPVQVGSDTNWLKIVVNDHHSIAVKTNGTLWSWGYGAGGGQLGLGNTTTYSSPKQIGALTNWATNEDSFDIGGYHTAAIKTDGTLWTWGWNYKGALGLGDTATRLSPVQVGALTNWLQVSANYRVCAAVKTDGTMWAWGRNNEGQLGQGNTTDRSSPVQIGSDTNWSKISIGNGTTAAIKTTGTMWRWGSNYAGALGLGDTTSRSSPVQVGALNIWTNACAGGAYSAAIGYY